MQERFTPPRQIIPFDTYNLFYRNGAIDGIRARLAAEAGMNPGAAPAFAVRGCG